MNYTTTVVCLTVIVVIILSPFIVYLSAKLWAYGTLRGRQLFQENQDHAKQEDQQT